METSLGFGISSLLNVFGGYRKTALRLIDVENNCVVETYTPHRYFALSYRWGEDVEQVKLESGTLSQKSGRRKVLLPKTIRDAITLTSRLEGGYLWTDVLCIIQDSEEDKKIQIGRMCNIYANAVLTIVAGEGENANAGLSRVCNHTTDRPLLHDTLDTAQRGWGSLLDGPWASRAWTYQETILSKRLLLVLQDRIDLFC
ncbi:HET-domain-containing protein, partial [Hyaloscypha variabilis F]